MTTLRQEKPRTSFRRLTSRLREAGFGKDFVRAAILPEWWSEACESDPAVLPEIEFAVARFVNKPLAVIRDPHQSIAPADVPGVQLRMGTAANRSRYLPAMHAGLAIAGAVARSLKAPAEYRPLPVDPATLRAEILTPPGREAVTLSGLTTYLWDHGIPVVRVDHLPSPKFRGMVAFTEGRPVVLLAWRGDDEPHFLWDLAHEAGHIAKGHVSARSFVVDEDDTTAEVNDLEREADAYAFRVLGDGNQPELKINGEPRTVQPIYLARTARGLGRAAHFDTGLLVHFWANKTGAYGPARRALEILRKLHAKETLAYIVDPRIDFENASETDANLLRCIRFTDTTTIH